MTHEFHKHKPNKLLRRDGLNIMMYTSIKIIQVTNILQEPLFEWSWIHDVDVIWFWDFWCYVLVVFGYKLWYCTSYFMKKTVSLTYCTCIYFLQNTAYFFNQNMLVCDFLLSLCHQLTDTNNTNTIMYWNNLVWLMCLG